MTPASGLRTGQEAEQSPASASGLRTGQGCRAATGTSLWAEDKTGMQSCHRYQPTGAEEDGGEELPGDDGRLTG